MSWYCGLGKTYVSIYRRLQDVLRREHHIINLSLLILTY